MLECPAHQGSAIAMKKTTGKKHRNGNNTATPGKRKPQRYRPQKPPRLRCFFGIRFTLINEIEGIGQALSGLKGEVADKLRLVPEQNLHVTLKFLGSVEESTLPTLESILKEAAARHSSFRLNVKSAGYFKNSCWVGIEPQETLSKLVQELNTAASALGVLNENKPYVPHVTVARFGKSSVDIKSRLLPILEQYSDQEWGTIQVEKICLYRSDTLAEGARYTVISEATLGD